MKTTVILDDVLVAEAKEFSGLTKTSQVINIALEEYVTNQGKLRLAKLQGAYKDSDLPVPPRRRDI